MAAPLFILSAGTPRITLTTFTPSSMVLSVPRRSGAVDNPDSKTAQAPATQADANKAGKR
jgi:hypothetical protein